ncbi:MAG TPA: HAMP domain-containing sensor histidine kinase [Anaerolineae bacterium]|nr:HAMP domain-containing sensor histidine kinase [Anaerolineae bacterium]
MKGGRFSRWRGYWVWVLVWVPLLLGFLGGFIWERSGWYNPIVYLRMSSNNILVLVGLLLSCLVGVGVGVGYWAEVKRKNGLIQQQRKAMKAHRRFLQRLDHELKNPLTAIRVALANFREATTAETRQAVVASIETQAVRLSRLTADLRKIAELETRPLERTQINLGELLDEIVGLIKDKPEAEGRKMVLSLPQAPWPLPTIVGDWDLIFLAVYNLVDNAVKFTGPEDTIEVRAREDGRFVIIEIADTGPGIGANEIDYIWQELYRGEGGRQVPGSGLGLALVKAVVERHGGRVSVRSRAGAGTVFVVQLGV